MFLRGRLLGGCQSFTYSNQISLSMFSDSGDDAKKSEQGKTAGVAGQGRTFPPALFLFFSAFFFSSALHRLQPAKTAVSPPCYSPLGASLLAKRSNRRGARRNGCFHWLSISHSLPSERPAAGCKQTVCQYVKSTILIRSQISTLQQQGVDHACFSGRGCLLLDLSQQVPIQDLFVIGKVRKYSLINLLQRIQIACNIQVIIQN